MDCKLILHLLAVLPGHKYLSIVVDDRETVDALVAAGAQRSAQVTSDGAYILSARVDDEERFCYLTVQWSRSATDGEREQMRAALAAAVQ